MPVAWALDGFTVTDTKRSNEEIDISVHSSNPVLVCAECGSTKLIKHDKVKRRIKDVPVGGLPVSIHATSSRWRCSGCGTTFVEILPGVSEHRNMTHRLVSWIETECLSKPFASVASHIGVDKKTIRNIFSAYSASRFPAPKFLPDRVAIAPCRLTKERLMVIDTTKGVVIEVLPASDSNTLREFLDGVNRDPASIVWIPERIEYCRAIADAMPDATIVVDIQTVIVEAARALSAFTKRYLKTLPAPVSRKLAHMLDGDPVSSQNDGSILDMHPQLRATRGAFLELHQIIQRAADTDPDSTGTALYGWFDGLSANLQDTYSEPLSLWRAWRGPLLKSLIYPLPSVVAAMVSSVSSNPRMSRPGCAFPVLRATIMQDGKGRAGSPGRRP